MLPRKAMAERLAKSFYRALQKPTLQEKRKVFDSQECSSYIMLTARRFICRTASASVNPQSSNPYSARCSSGLIGAQYLHQSVNRSSCNLFQISGDLTLKRNPGFLAVSASPCQQVVSYRTAARHRSSTTGKEGTGSTDKSSNKTRLKDEKDVDQSPEQGKDSEIESTSIFQRFKKAYKEHGKILIGVHLVTSTVWFGSFFYAASVGIDVVPWLEHIGVSETLIKPFRSPNVGNIAMAYLMYKLATPARYTVTLGGTNMVIRYMRNTGRMEPLAEGQSLRELYKEGRTHMHKRRAHHQRHSVKHHRRSK